MIEKYFELGVRFKWNKPANVDGPPDGAMVLSQRPTAPMTYVGLGATVSPKLMMTHVSTLGLQMNMLIQHQWLDYAPGRTAKVPIGPYDVLTGFMSGCLIARWIEKGVTYVGHVGTVESNPAANRVVKRAFGFKMPSTTTGFYPAAAMQDKAYELGAKLRMDPKICALVTTSGQFYSVLMLRSLSEVNGEWYCGGCKLVPPLSHDTIKMQMMRDE